MEWNISKQPRLIVLELTSTISQGLNLNSQAILSFMTCWPEELDIDARPNWKHRNLELESCGKQKFIWLIAIPTHWPFAAWKHSLPFQEREPHQDYWLRSSAKIRTDEKATSPLWYARIRGSRSCGLWAHRIPYWHVGGRSNLLCLVRKPLSTNFLNSASFLSQRFF